MAYSALQEARAEGLKVGLFRPVTLYPFPSAALRELAGRVKALLVVELSLGQMVEDVRLAVEGACPVEFFGRSGGIIITPTEVVGALRKCATSMGNAQHTVAGLGKE